MARERVIVIDVSVTTAPAGDVIVLDLWAAGAPPAETGIRLLQVEPRRWWLIGAGEGAADIAAGIADSGAVTPIGGGLVRATLDGPGWRTLLMVSGCSDAEDPSFGIGQVAATTIHHVPVWIAVTGDTTCEVYMASSYAPALTELWAGANNPA